MGVWCTVWLVDWPGKTPNRAVAELEEEHRSFPMAYYPVPSYDRKSNYLACFPISSCPSYINLSLRNLPQYLQIHPSASFLRILRIPQQSYLPSLLHHGLWDTCPNLASSLRTIWHINRQNTKDNELTFAQKDCKLGFPSVVLWQFLWNLYEFNDL